MSDLSFEIQASAGGPDRPREGLLLIGGQELRYSAPLAMGGAGLGASPETLLVSAVGACYSLTLIAVLSKRGLPNRGLNLGSEGIVSGVPGADRFEKIIVSPTIVDGDPERLDEYEQAARRAHERCFIGNTVSAGGLGFELGTVAISKAI